MTNSFFTQLPNKIRALTYMFASLHSRNFRLYFIGMSVSLVGTWMQQIAMQWLVYRLTGSVMLLAAITFMAQMPILLTTPFMGVLVDRFNRRNILVFTQTASAIQATLIAVLTLMGWIEVWHLMVLSLVIGLINALDTPTRQAFYTSLVPQENLTNAIALNSAVINGARLIGPAVGGILISLVGEGVCFLINGLSYTAVIGALFAMRIPKSATERKPQRVISSLSEGFTYVSHSVPIASLLLIMASVSLFGLPLMTFLSAYVKDILYGDSRTLGYMLSCIGIGSFSAAICLAAKKKVTGLSRFVSYGGLVLGVSLVVLSFLKTAWIAALVCIPAGYCIIITVASINSLLQTLSDEDKRGRVMGYLAMTFTGITPLGSLFFGWLEGYTGLTGIIFIAGTCCFLAGAVFEHYRPLISKHAYMIYREKGVI